jgi:hypothetical protein
MLKSIGTFTIVCALCAGAAQTATAHERGHDHYEATRHHHASMHRDWHMPHWLHHDKGFRVWYGRSSLRHNYFLAWWQLHEIYRWERRYDHRRGHAVHYGARHHDYDWYRRYWHQHDRRHDRQHHGKRKSHRESRHSVTREPRRRRYED